MQHKAQRGLLNWGILLHPRLCRVHPTCHWKMLLLWTPFSIFPGWLLSIFCAWIASLLDYNLVLLADHKSLYFQQNIWELKLHIFHWNVEGCHVGLDCEQSLFCSKICATKAISSTCTSDTSKRAKIARTGAHDTTGSLIRRSDIAFVPKILEQKKNCSQTNMGRENGVVFRFQIIRCFGQE